MKNLIAKVCAGVFTMLLAACTSNPSPEMVKVQEKKVTAAKINIRLGVAYLQRQDVQRSKQKLLFALDLAPKLPEAWYSMAYFLESTGNPEQAQSYYLKALALAPKQGEVLNNYGTYLCRRGNYPNAIHHFIEATRDPNYLDIAAAYENAGLCSLKIPNRNQAMAYFRKALAEDPSRTTSLIELAELNYRQGHYKQAKQELSQFLKVAPPNAKSYALEKNIDKKQLA